MQKVESPDPSLAKQTLLPPGPLRGSGRRAAEARPAPDASEVRTEFMTRAVGYQLSPDEREELVEIDRALDRIDYGRWGVCQLCGERIDPDRLAARPEARECRRCAPRPQESLS